MKKIPKDFLLPTIILLIALAILAGSLYSGAHQPNSATSTGSENISYPQTTSSTTNASTATPNLKQSGSLRTLFTNESVQKCNFISGSLLDPQSGTLSGTIYLGGINMRGDLLIKNKAHGALETHIIRQNDKVFLWTQKQGIQISYSDFIKAKQTASADVNLDRIGNYTCQSWTADPSQFKLPPGTTFLSVVAPAE